MTKKAMVDLFELGPKLTPKRMGAKLPIYLGTCLALTPKRRFSEAKLTPESSCACAGRAVTKKAMMDLFEHDDPRNTRSAI